MWKNSWKMSQQWSKLRTTEPHYAGVQKSTVFCHGLPSSSLVQQTQLKVLTDVVATIFLHIGKQLWQLRFVWKRHPHDVVNSRTRFHHWCCVCIISICIYIYITIFICIYWIYDICISSYYIYIYKYSVLLVWYIFHSVCTNLTVHWF